MSTTSTNSPLVPCMCLGSSLTPCPGFLLRASIVVCLAPTPPHTRWSSSAGEPHPHALTQRDVNLSIHPAPIVQPQLH